MKILLADDDLVIRRLLQRTLERSGFEVVCAGNGQSAAEALVDPDGPRIAVLDWMMPGIHGPDVCRYVRSQPGNLQRYLILLTSREKREDVLMGLEAGADDYLIKPCAREEVKARVRAGQRILELQDRMAHESLHDSVTQLPNRAFFTRRLAENAQRAKENSDYQFTVLLVGVDRFKTINDGLGYSSGDELLKSTARRLLQSVRTGYPDADPLRTGQQFADIVTRFYGDEFAVLLENSRGTSDGIRVAQRIQHLFEPAFCVDGHEVFLTVSIGIAASDSKWGDSKDILRSADLAMHKAKELGRSRFEISNTDESIAFGLDPFQVEHDIRRAIQHSEFEVYYQPIVRLDNYRIHGFEALARWRHPQLGILAPTEFLGVAEETGLICAIGQNLMRTACEQMVEWNAQFGASDPATISVNISPKQFDPINLVELVRQTIRESGINPRNLELEVTENLTMEHADRAIVVLEKLSELGISLGLDDFGSGYSSLNYLQRFPLATLKIDRAFIADIETSQKSCAIAKTVIALGHGLGMRVVAEGIETPGQMKILSRFGCDLGQGFLFSRPMPADMMAQLMTESRQGFMLNPYIASAISPLDSVPHSWSIWSGASGIREFRYDSGSSHCDRRTATRTRHGVRSA